MQRTIVYKLKPTVGQRSGLERYLRVTRELFRVKAPGTSQQCSTCGAHVPKTLSDRHHQCSRCGLHLHRDHNAALNIHHRAWATPVAEAAYDVPSTPPPMKREAATVHGERSVTPPLLETLSPARPR